MERSERILQGLGNQYYRATLKSMGFTTEDLKRPVIGIANAWSECVPGHYNLRQVAQRVKDGIYRAGGTPIEFGVIGGCDGMGQGHDGMHYILPSRELIANSIESMAQINLFDGLVLLGSCDKIVPGMLMAAARLDIPCIFLPGGPMEGGVEFDGRQADQTSSTEAYGMLSAGKITEAEYVALEDTACPGCGSCSYLGTANTMCALAEALGMTLPDGGLAPATSAVRMMMAEETGVKIDISEEGNVAICGTDKEMIEKAKSIIKNIVTDIEPGQIITGKVVRIMPFGAFVELKPKKDGMIHISRLSDKRVEKVEDVVNIGDMVTVKVLDVDKMGKISLSMKPGDLVKKESEN